MPWGLVQYALVAAAVPMLGMAAAGGAPPLPDSYLLRVERALALGRADLSQMQQPAEQAAACLAAGGALWIGGNPGLVSELTGRAGGFMLAKALGEAPVQAGDVVIFFAPAQEKLPAAVRQSGALVVLISGKHQPGASHWLPDHAAACGLSPTLAGAVPGWLFTGELVAALTRLGKMPVLFESIGLCGGIPRIRRYQEQGIFWHEQHQVPPLAAGALGGRYAEVVSAMVRRVEAQERKQLDQAGAWAAQAHREEKRLIMYSMGHLFPSEVEKTDIGKLFTSAVWNTGFSYYSPPDHQYQRGDVLIHIGYQHPPTPMLDRAAQAGARVVYVDVLADRDYVGNPEVIWIDPMWPWSDACVPVPGYDIPALASSGVVNGAIAWEIYRCARRAAP